MIYNMDFTACINTELSTLPTVPTAYKKSPDF